MRVTVEHGVASVSGWLTRPSRPEALELISNHFRPFDEVAQSDLVRTAGGVQRMQIRPMSTYVRHPAHRARSALAAGFRFLENTGGVGVVARFS